MTTSIAIPHSYMVQQAGTLPDGENYFVLSCQDYETFSTLPAAMSYGGQSYGLTGWNSDYCTAYYKAGKQFASKM